MQKTLLFVIALLLVFPSRFQPQSSDVIEVGKFSAEDAGDALPAGWKPLTFRNIDKHTLYRLVKDGDMNCTPEFGHSS